MEGGRVPPIGRDQIGTNIPFQADLVYRSDLLKWTAVNSDARCERGGVYMSCAQAYCALKIGAALARFVFITRSLAVFTHAMNFEHTVLNQKLTLLSQCFKLLLNDSRMLFNNNFAFITDK